MDKSQLARKRAAIIMKVNCGLMTASQAAKELNVSRKTYYKWEQKGLAALLGSVTDQPAGRPEKQQDKAQENLKKKLAQSIKENEILHHRMVLKDILSQISPGSENRVKKK